MAANNGYKRVGGAGLNGKVLRWESIGGGVFKCHCYPGIASATRLVSPGGGESYTEYHSWYGSGNVVSFPEPYSPYGAAGNYANSNLCGTAAVRAVRGNTWIALNHPLLAGLPFWIVKAEAGAGDDFSGVEGDTWAQQQVIGDFFRFDEHFAGSKPLMEITDLQTQYTGSVNGTWHSLGAAAVVPVANADRSYTYTGDPVLDPIRLQWDHLQKIDEAQLRPVAAIYNGGAGNAFRTVIITQDPHGLASGNIIYLQGTANGGESDGNHVVTVYDAMILISDRTGLTPAGEGAAGEWIRVGPGSMIQTGSQRGYLNWPAYGYLSFNAGAIVLGANKARVLYRINGVEQTPKQITVRTPTVELGFPGANPSSWPVLRRDRKTGLAVTMSYGGGSINDYDPFLSTSVDVWKFNSAENKIYFHPLLTGDEVRVIYKTSEPVGFGTFGAPGLFMQPWQYNLGGGDDVETDWAHVKRADVLWIKDSAGLLAAAGSLNDFEFAIGTNGVMLEGSV